MKPKIDGNTPLTWTRNMAKAKYFIPRWDTVWEP